MAQQTGLQSNIKLLCTTDIKQVMQFTFSLAGNKVHFYVDLFSMLNKLTWDTVFNAGAEAIFS
jgi:hypothetical protein